MIGAALTYPFLFARRRPVSLLATLLIGCVLKGLASMLVSPGQMLDVGAQFPHFYALFYAAQYFSQELLQAALIAMLLAAALVDLRVRNRKPNLLDMPLLAAARAAFMLVVMAPFYGLQYGYSLFVQQWMRVSVEARAGAESISSAEAASWTEPMWWYAPSVVLFLIAIIIYVRLAFAWPRTLATGQFTFFRSWAETRGKFWRLAGALLPAAGAMLIVFAVGGWLFSLVTMSLYAPSMDFRWDDPAASMRVTVIMVASAVLNGAAYMIGTLYFDLVLVFLYARAQPQRPGDVADVF
jgi:hypothetical protein